MLFIGLDCIHQRIIEGKSNGFFFWLLGYCWALSLSLLRGFPLRPHSSFLILLIQEIVKRGLKVSVVGIPKTIDNDIAVSRLSAIFPYHEKIICFRPCLFCSSLVYTSEPCVFRLLIGPSALTLPLKRHSGPSTLPTSRLKAVKMASA